MNITVTIPNAKVAAVVEALNGAPTPGWEAPAEDATAQEVGTAVTDFYRDKWLDEVRATVIQHRRQAAIQAAVEADDAAGDPLA